jgi:hypothetical protein
VLGGETGKTEGKRAASCGIPKKYREIRAGGKKMWLTKSRVTVVQGSGQVELFFLRHSGHRVNRENS